MRFKTVESIDSLETNARQTFTANDAKVNFDAFIDAAHREPVWVTRRDRVVGVMVAVQDDEAMRAFHAGRLQHTLTKTGTAALGMTPESLERLLSDQS